MGQTSFNHIYSRIQVCFFNGCGDHGGMDTEHTEDVEDDEISSY